MGGGLCLAPVFLLTTDRRREVMPKYVFYIILDTGEEVRWPGLTLTQARNMYKWTKDRLPRNVSTFGWEEMK